MNLCGLDVSSIDQTGKHPADQDLPRRSEPPPEAVDDVQVAGKALEWAVALLSGESSGSEMPGQR